MANQAITVREIEAGDFEVARGGYVIGGRGAVVRHYSVRAGERVSAGEISEWIANGVEVEHQSTPSAA